MDSTSYSHIPTQNIDGVFLDLDNTLYAYGPAHETALAACYDVCKDHIPDFETFKVRYKAARDVVTARLCPQGACRSRLFAFQALAESWGVAQSYCLAMDLDDLYWNSFLCAMRPNKEALLFLQRLMDEKIPTCLVSDMTAAVQVRKLKALGMTPYIKYMVTSEEVGAEKPDPRMFLTALEKLKITPDRAIMLGDDMKKDVLGAQNLGITAYLISLSEAS